MKNIIYISLLLINVNLSWGQTDCINNVSTNFESPTNDALPVGIESDKYLNGFNWFPVAESGLYEDYPCTDITFGGIVYPEMNSILLNSLTDYDYLTDGPKPLNENGWELLLVNLGRYPDDVTPIVSGNFNYALPYIIIYNRYSGTIRVFMNFGLDHSIGDGADAMKISISFPNEFAMSGLLRLNQGIDQALNETSNVIQITSIAKAPAFGHQWASTDFKIAYDPCTCYYPSFIKINFGQVKSTDIQIHGRSITLEDEPLVDNVNLQVNAADYLNGFDHTGNSETFEGGGVAMHKSIVFMLEDYIAKYEKYNKDLVEIGEHNKKVKTNLAILKMGKFIAGLIINPVGGIIPPNPLQTEMAAELAAAESLGLTPEEIEEAYEGLGVGNTDWFKVAKNLKSGLVKANESGQAIIDNALLFNSIKQIFGEKGTTFIASNFEEKSMPSAPTTPTATFSEMHYSASILQELDIGGTRFYNPGTYGSEGTGSPVITNVYEYPVYNDVLGTFALLKKPKIKISKSLASNQIDTLAYYSKHLGGAYSNLFMQRYQSWSLEYQIQLAENLEYALNDVLDIKEYHIQASYNIIATNTFIGIPLETILTAFHDPLLNINVESNNTNLDESYTQILARGKPYHYYYDNPDFTETLFDDYGAFIIPPLEIGLDTLNFQTPYVPIDAFQPVVAGIGIKNETVRLNKQLISNVDTSIAYEHDPLTGRHEFDVSNPLVIRPGYVDYITGSAGLEYQLYVELKLIVDIEFNSLNSDSLPNSISQVLTYPIHPDNITWYDTELVPNLGESNKNFGDYEEYLYFDDILFYGQEVLGCKLEDGHYSCIATNKITIDGNIRSSSSYTVDMIAGNLIEVVYESQVSPEIVLRIDTILDYSHPMPKANQHDVRIFCQGATGTPPDYLANISTRSEHKAIDDGEEKIEDANITKEKFSFYLYPNPAQTEAFIEVSDADYEITVNVTDITGKQVGLEVINDGKGIYKLNISNFAQGIYLITVSSNGLSRTKRLMIH